MNYELAFTLHTASSTHEFISDTSHIEVLMQEATPSKGEGA